MRLDKFLAVASVDTRKNIRDFIKAGLVKVNGQVVTEPALIIDENIDIVKFKDEVIKDLDRVYYMFHKPAGCITARSDKENKTVLDYFQDINTKGLFHVGRLDKDTEGLLLLTNDGDFEHRIMYPDKHVEKTYFFCALGALDDKKIKSLREGVSIGSGEALTKPAQVEVAFKGNYKEISEELNLEKFYSVNSKTFNQPVVAGYLTITEGRKHQVKRMLKAVGCFVIYLKRTSIGGLVLDENLEKGSYRRLKEEEINIIFENV